MLSRLRALWRNLARAERVSRDIDDEIRGSFEMLVDEYLARGLSAVEARRRASLEFGGVEPVKERVRDARAGAAFDALRQDVRYALRMLGRNPIFTVVAALSLAVGIAATTTIFTVANGLLFRAPGGVGEPDGLVDVFHAREGQAMGNFTTSYPYYRDLRERVTTLAGLFAFDLNLKNVAVGSTDGTELAFAMLVTSNYFRVLKVAPFAGRVFDRVDDLPAGDEAQVVLSYRFWQRRFAGNRAIVGRIIRINRQPFAVVGVASEQFRGTNVAAPDLWIPFSMVSVIEPGSSRLTNRSMLDLGMGGRLKPGISMRQAAAELHAIAAGLERERRADEPGVGIRLSRLSSVPGPIAMVAAGLLASLLAVVSSVLIIACANVSGVLLARAAARRREIAVRIAIGAGRARLVRQFLTETAALFVLGGSCGLVLARVLTSLLVSLLPAAPIPVQVTLPLDLRVVAFTIGVSLIAALLSGAAPALHAARADVVVALKDESQGPTDRLRLRSAFVVAQVAFSIMLVVIASLLVQALQRMAAIDQGFDPAGVDVASMDLSAAGYTSASGEAFSEQLLTRLRAERTVASASLSQWLPGRGGSDVRVTVPGVAPPTGEPFFIATWNAIATDFFATLHAPLLAGREFTNDDSAGSEPVVIVSESTAKLLWPGDIAVGKYVTWLVAWSDNARTPHPTTMKVVGVSRDLMPRVGAPTAIRDRRPDGTVGMRPPPPLMMYVPLHQRFSPKLSLFMRSATRSGAAAEVRGIVKAFDANIPMAVPQPLDAQSGPIYLQLRLAASIAGSVGLVGLLLAAIGVYGVAAYTASSRTREIGVRIALGASRSDVMRLILGQGMSLVFCGSIIGLVLAVGASRLFRSLLSGVSPIAPATLAGAVALFTTVGLIACYVPARRATRIEATTALRYE